MIALNESTPQPVDPRCFAVAMLALGHARGTLSTVISGIEPKEEAALEARLCSAEHLGRSFGLPPELFEPSVAVAHLGERCADEEGMRYIPRQAGHWSRPILNERTLAMVIEALVEARTALRQAAMPDTDLRSLHSTLERTANYFIARRRGYSEDDLAMDPAEVLDSADIDTWREPCDS